MIDRSRVLAGLAVGLVVVALLAVVGGEPMLAGLCFIGVAFTIFLRETRT